MEKYYLECLDTDEKILSLPAFNKEAIKKAIIDYLNQNPLHTIVYYKVCEDQSVYVGDDALGVYEVNPRNKKPSRCFFRGNKTYYTTLTN